MDSPAAPFVLQYVSKNSSWSWQRVWPKRRCSRTRSYAMSCEARAVLGNLLDSCVPTVRVALVARLYLDTSAALRVFQQFVGAGVALREQREREV